LLQHVGCEALKFKDIWPDIISAIEKIIVCYDCVNEVISLRTDVKAREYAIKHASVQDNMFGVRRWHRARNDI